MSESQTKDQIYVFNQLCAIKPTEWVSRFPYSYLSQDKIKFTEKVIDLAVKSEKSGGGSGDGYAGLEIYA